MTSTDTSSYKEVFPHGSVADWLADGISATEELTRGRYALTSYLLVLALEALAMEVSEEASKKRGSS